MKYKSIITVTSTIYVEAIDLPNLMPGDVFSNSRQRDKYELINDGGIDFRENVTPKIIAKYKKQGKFLILYKGNVYQYHQRKKEATK